tara:strand:- start:73 stop:531 length:459 start_codon:yes stop_codon:yes gene_type:complete
MDQLLNTGVLKDVSVLAGAALGVFALQKLRRIPNYTCLGAYPNVEKSAMAPVLAALHELEGDGCAFHEVARLTESFINLVHHGDVNINGFAVNRMSFQINAKLQAACDRSKYSPSVDVAIRGIDFERDHLEHANALMDNLLRNMLLATPAYA